MSVENLQKYYFSESIKDWALFQKISNYYKFVSTSLSDDKFPSTSISEEALKNSIEQSGLNVTSKVLFQNNEVGYLACSFKSEKKHGIINSVVAHVAPLLRFEWDIQMLALDWLSELYESIKEKSDWCGIYWKEPYLGGSEELLGVGPYIGPLTPHERIPFKNGICGLAISKEKSIYVPDVRKESQFLSCSPLTRSELVIPISNSHGHLVAELDIDSNSLDVFNEDDIRKIEYDCQTFSLKLP